MFRWLPTGVLFCGTRCSPAPARAHAGPVEPLQRHPLRWPSNRMLVMVVMAVMMMAVLPKEKADSKSQHGKNNLPNKLAIYVASKHIQTSSKNGNGMNQVKSLMKHLLVYQHIVFRKMSLVVSTRYTIKDCPSVEWWEVIKGRISLLLIHQITCRIPDSIPNIILLRPSDSARRKITSITVNH